jgi:cell division transport system ATP-binding protein
LLADEPTGHLDPEVSLEIMQLFKELNQSGMAIIMASHDYNTMAKVSGQILKCEGGKIFPVSSL